MRTTVLATLAVVFSFGLAFALGEEEEAAARAKRIEECIQKGLAAHRANQPQEAIAQLQQAVLLLQKSVEKNLAAFLPKPREGWTADDPEVQSGVWGSGEQSFQITTATRNYSREEDGRSVEIVLTNSPQMVDAQKQLITTFANPQMAAMLGADPDRKLETFKEDGWDGMLTVEKDGEAQITAVTGNVLLTIRVDAPDEDLVREFWKALDRKALASVASPK